MFPRKASTNMYNLKELMELMNKADHTDFDKFHQYVNNIELLYCPGNFYVDGVKYAIRYDKFDGVLTVFNTTNGDTLFHDKLDKLMVLVLIRTIRLHRISNNLQESFMLSGHPVMFNGTKNIIKLHGIMGDFPVSVCFGHSKDDIKEIIIITKDMIETMKAARIESGEDQYD